MVRCEPQDRATLQRDLDKVPVELTMRRGLDGRRSCGTATCRGNNHLAASKRFDRNISTRRLNTRAGRKALLWIAHDGEVPVVIDYVLEQLELGAGRVLETRRP